MSQLNTFKLNTLHLKIIATLLMVIDHVAYLLIPETEPIYWIMRIIGRLSAPLFWFCFTEGFRYTSNRKKYILRLGIATCVMALGNCVINALGGGVISFNLTPTQPNIFWTFFLMSVVIICVEQAIESSKMQYVIGWGLLAVILGIIVGLYAEYGWIALCSILCLYFLKHQVLKYLVFIIANTLLCILSKNIIQIFMILAVLLMMSCGKEKPKYKLKWFFYVFYPLHLWFFMLIHMVM